MSYKKFIEKELKTRGFKNNPHYDGYDVLGVNTSNDIALVAVEFDNDDEPEMVELPFTKNMIKEYFDEEDSTCRDGVCTLHKRRGDIEQCQKDCQLEQDGPWDGTCQCRNIYVPKIGRAI